MKQGIILAVIILIPALVWSEHINWVEHPIGDHYTCWEAYFIDLDQDGYTDVLATSTWEHNVVWWRNDGNNVDFTAHYLAQGDFYGASSIQVLDMEGDGDLDVMAVNLEGEIAWWENDGYQNFLKREIDSGYRNIYDAYFADLDNDGDIDITTAHLMKPFADTVEFDMDSVFDVDSSDVYWFENNGKQTFIPHPIEDDETHIIGAAGIYCIDMGKDGDQDIIIAHFFNDQIIWYENDGAMNLTKHVLNGSVDSTRAVWADDVDGDDDIDILATAQGDGNVFWWENDGDKGFTQRWVDSNLVGPWDIATYDLDQDGDTDIIGTDFGSPPARPTPEDGSGDAVLWWDNDGSETFLRRYIAQNHDGAKSVFPIDFDGDGDIDVGHSDCWTNRIYWHENQTINPGAHTKLTSVPIMSEQTYYSKAYPIGGDHGIPTMVQVIAVSSDSLTIADSINFDGWVEYSIDGINWYNPGDVVTSGITDTLAHRWNLTQKKGWNYVRTATQGNEGNDNSGDVEAEFRFGNDKGYITR